MLSNVVAVVGDEIAAFELGVVAEVFGLDRTGQGLPGYDFAVCAVNPGRIPTSSGFAVMVDEGLERMRAADLVVVPSWTSRDVVPPPALVAALHEAMARGAKILSVCSGAFLLASARLLDGKRAATHWRYAPILARRYPDIEVDAEVLYVDEGAVMTSAGTAAAIDACLYIVRQEHGAEVANAIARRMVVPGHRHGGQAQFIETQLPESEVGNGLAELLEWAELRLSEPLSVKRMAAQAVMSERTFLRRFYTATGTTPHKWILEKRLALAEQLLETTDLPVDQVAQNCGFANGDSLRHHFARRRMISPGEYRRSFRGRLADGAAGGRALRNEMRTA
jgi:transcriptional regulator GlxA family with amidase domain